MVGVVGSYEGVEKPNRSVKITDHFTCISANVIYCIACRLCKKTYKGETGRILADLFREHLRDLERSDKDAKNSVAPFLSSSSVPPQQDNLWPILTPPGTQKAAKISNKNSSSN